MATGIRKPTSYIDPERLYTLSGYQQSSGIAKTRIREARLQGLVLKTVDVGKRKFVRGRDGIDFIEKLATLDK